MKIEGAFVVSAAAARDLPRDGLAEIALVGRSNVGKSTLINALVRQRLARTSRAPGKTRLANVYRVRRGSSPPFYLVDLPGYGYARGQSGDLARIAGEYFPAGSGMPRRSSQEFGEAEAGGPARLRKIGGLLLVDSRHPGLQRDLEAWAWLKPHVDACAIVVTKTDKLSRSERQRAKAAHEAVFGHPVVSVSAETGEGLDELWKLIDRMTTSE